MKNFKDYILTEDHSLVSESKEGKQMIEINRGRKPGEFALGLDGKETKEIIIMSLQSTLTTAINEKVTIRVNHYNTAYVSSYYTYIEELRALNKYLK